MRRAAAFAILVGMLSIAGCDDDGDRTRIGPSDLRAGVGFTSGAVSIQPSLIDPIAVATPRCPVRHAFVAPFSLIVRADGGSDLFLRQIDMEFVDLMGIRGASRTITGTELDTLFGPTLIPAFGARTFPLTLPLGCAWPSTGTVDIFVLATDASGRESRQTRRVGVR